jgi:site-specific DNA recombinase
MRGRTYGYCRVSSQHQEERGTSLDGQRDEIERYCRARGWPAPTLFVEVESGGEKGEERRVEQQRLIAETKPGDIIICWAVDRWSRNIPFAVGEVRRLVKRGVGWHSATESIDASTSQGDDMLGIRAWAADMEHKKIKERTVGRREALAAQGFYPYGGEPPLGYRRGDRDKGLQLLLEPDPATKPIRVELLERCARGESLSTLMAWIADVHPTAADKKTLAATIRSRLPLGEVRARGVWVPGKHVPIVSRDLWERAQAALTARRNGGRRPERGTLSAALLLRGIAVCALCGRRVSTVVKEVRGTTHAYYACQGRLRMKTCTLPYFRAADLDAAAGDAVAARLRDLRADLAREPAASAPAVRAVVDFEAERGKLARKRARLVEAFAEERITKADLALAVAKIEGEVGRLAVREAEVARLARGTGPKARAAVLADVGRLEKAWRRVLRVEDRREVVTHLAARIEIGAKGPRFEWRSAEELAAEALP